MMGYEKLRYLAALAVTLVALMAAISWPQVRAAVAVKPRQLEWQRRMRYQGRHWR